MCTIALSDTLRTRAKKQTWLVKNSSGEAHTLRSNKTKSTRDIHNNIALDVRLDESKYL